MTARWKQRNTFQVKIKVYEAIVLSSLVYGNDTYHHHIQLRDKFYQHLFVPYFTPDGRAEFPTMRSQNSCNPEKLKSFYTKVNSPGLRQVEHMAGRWNWMRVPCSTAWSNVASQQITGKHLQLNGYSGQ